MENGEWTMDNYYAVPLPILHYPLSIIHYSLDKGVIK